MSENRKNDPFQYDFDEQWDVERELYGHLMGKPKDPAPGGDDIDVLLPTINKRAYTAKEETPTPIHEDTDAATGRYQRRSQPKVVPVPIPEDESGSEDNTQDGSSGSVPAPRPVKRSSNGRKKKGKPKPNYKGWAILAAIALTAIILLYLLIRFFVWVVSPGKGADADNSTESLIVETIPSTTVDYDAIAADLIEQADLQAAMYDYDGAIATIKSFGYDWGTRTDLTEAIRRYDQLKLQTVRWEDTTTIPHIFFHILVADNDRAFDGDYTEAGYNQYMTTIPEFKAILEELYARDYVLIRIHDIAQLTTDENGNQVYRQGDIYLPEGKKPIVISQDDVNFYEYMIDSDGDHLPDAGGDGFASKLLVDAHGDITCEYVTAEGEVVYGDYDLVPILERFVEEHPDFSYRGAKAIVALTGYEGVYGYRTDKDGKARMTAEEFQKEIDGAKAVNQWLKDNGWEIASHSYGHPSYGSLTWDELAHDVSRWEEEVQPVVGDTDIFIYPYGSDIAGVENYSGAKYDTMYEAGYRFFCNVDSSEYWVHIRNNYVRQGRRNLDGYRMWYDPELLDDLFDATAIFDSDRPTPVPPI